MGALDTLIPTLEVSSAITPPVDVSTAGVKGGGPSPVVRFLKPAVRALDASGNELVRIAPYGEATDGERTMKMLAIAGAVVGVLVLVFLLGRATK